MVRVGCIEKKKLPNSRIIINEILYREDITSRKIDVVNEALTFMSHQLKVKFHRLNKFLHLDISTGMGYISTTWKPRP